MFNFKNTLFVLRGFVVTSIIIFTFISSNVDNAIGFSSNASSTLYSFMPQGWAFFTRDPKEDIFNFYQIDDDNLVLLNEAPSLNPKQFFGFNRTSRKINIDMSYLVTNIPSKLWKDFSNMGCELYNLNSHSFLSQNLQNDEFKGEYLLVKKRRKPWAWKTGQTKMPQKAVRIIIL